LSPSSAGADGAKYQDWKGAWARFVPPGSELDVAGVPTAGGQPSFDQTNPWGFGQPDQAKGGEGHFFDHAVRCMPGGMPLDMIAFRPLEFVVTPDTTYVLIGDYDHYRRIFTDGRDWPKDIEPTYAGYSIGK
jgi:hypothetical protein